MGFGNTFESCCHADTEQISMKSRDKICMWSISPNLENSKKLHLLSLTDGTGYTGSTAVFMATGCQP